MFKVIDEHSIVAGAKCASPSCHKSYVSIEDSGPFGILASDPSNIHLKHCLVTICD